MRNRVVVRLFADADIANASSQMSIPQMSRPVGDAEMSLVQLA
jgi:hypothetical protein